MFLTLPWQPRKTAAKCLSAVVQADPQWSDIGMGGLDAAVTKEEFNARAVLEAIQCLATPTHQEREALAVGALLLAHHPNIGIFNLVPSPSHD